MDFFEPADLDSEDPASAALALGSSLAAAHPVLVRLALGAALVCVALLRPSAFVGFFLALSLLYVYHSSFNAIEDVPQVGNMAVLPLKAKTRGFAPVAADPAADDIVDEALDLFRANSLFRNFEIQGPADRVLIYLILFTSECLGKLTPATTRDAANKLLYALAVGPFAIPGEGSFPLNALYAAPATRADADNMKAYLQQLRTELFTRLVDKLYAEDNAKPSKWWMAFAKRKFMGKSL
ncbi:subunit of the Arp2/3 complex [Blastocladiella emersonii ATCC 22665]|nr:subunit of the Arp2/3 complex [Blastocladiella emersonii ATCC 22665]